MSGTVLGTGESAMNKEQSVEILTTIGLVELCPGCYENKREEKSPSKVGGQTQS